MRTFEALDKYLMMVFVTMAIIGFASGFLFFTITEMRAEGVEDSETTPKLGGRKGIEDCPFACYDERSGAIINFERTKHNLNIIVEQQGFVLMEEFVVKTFYEEDGFYYADIDDVVVRRCGR